MSRLQSLELRHPFTCGHGLWLGSHLFCEPGIVCFTHLVGNMARPPGQQAPRQCQGRTAVGRILWYRIKVDDFAAGNQITHVARHLDDGNLAIVPDIKRSAAIESVAPKEALE